MTLPTISFDLDHTLMINPFRKWIFPELEEWFRPRLPAGSPSVLQRMAEEHRSRLKRKDFVRAYDWDDIWNRLTAEVGEPSPFTVEELVRRHATIGKVWRFSDAMPALEELQSRGIPLVVATNGLEKYQRPVTDCLGLTPLFTDFHTPCKQGCAKPEADFFRSCPRPLLHVGDRLDQDILGANRSGAVSVWIHRDLPAEWRTLSPEERKKHPKWRHLLQEKLKKEGCEGPLTPELEPDFPIMSLEELPAVWERIRNRSRA
ncbi:FMN phosphatase YigB (HAD superfamily) [Melghirimyces profundicolus]|uniref:FMN phosphatase YigB (HAD superfamily) n=1 Tax=Melghirimyces profundicolus TaxID=1242148 RepID=A0A2T6BQG2_9BACL|nr:HAD family hydrolase [Melghirimyces profundicolus]PTX58308.1 FMN phosphatase YigB (HAD superfamily) [Melghirimyces profundicolus]